MGAASNSVIKFVHQEGIGEPVKLGDQVTIHYSGAWANKNEAHCTLSVTRLKTPGASLLLMSQRFFPTIGECRESFSIGDSQGDPCMGKVSVLA